MRLSSKQEKELAVIQYFVPGWVEFDPITDEDIRAFFAWSDRGVKYPLNLQINNGLAALHYGKQYRDLQTTTWKEDIEAGLTTKGEILANLPGGIVPWVEKALSSAMLGSPMYESVNGEMVFAGYEKPDAIEFRTRYGKVALHG